jgi:hypothetical protein
MRKFIKNIIFKIFHKKVHKAGGYTYYRFRFNFISRAIVTRAE